MSTLFIFHLSVWNKKKLVHFLPSEFVSSWTDSDRRQTVWPDWAIYWTLGNFLKPLATINLPKSPIFLGIFFVKMSKSISFVVKSIWGNFYRHLAIFFWSHWRQTLFWVGPLSGKSQRLSFTGTNTAKLVLPKHKCYKIPTLDFDALSF